MSKALWITVDVALWGRYTLSRSMIFYKHTPEWMAATIRLDHTFVFLELRNKQKRSDRLEILYWERNILCAFCRRTETPVIFLSTHNVFWMNPAKYVHLVYLLHAKFSCLWWLLASNYWSQSSTHQTWPGNYLFLIRFCGWFLWWAERFVLLRCSHRANLIDIILIFPRYFLA